MKAARSWQGPALCRPRCSVGGTSLPLPQTGVTTPLLHVPLVPGNQPLRDILPLGEITDLRAKR